MTTFYSEEITNIDAVPPVALSPLDHHGRLRIATVNYDQVADGSAGDILEMCKLPAGRVILLGTLSNLYINLTTGSMKVEIGWLAYTDLNGDAVVADPNGLDSTKDVDTAGVFTIGSVAAVLAEGQNKTFESQDGVTLTMTFTTDVAADDSVKGNVTYVLD